MQLVSAIGLIVGIYSMLGVYATALPGGDQGIDISYTDPVVVPFTLTPSNGGYVDSSLEVHVAMIVDGEVVATDSTSVDVPAGTSVPVGLELSIPLDDAQGYFQSSVDLKWVIDIRVTSLFDMISFSNKMVIEGGAQ